MIIIAAIISIIAGVLGIIDRKKNPLDNWGMTFGDYSKGVLFIIFGIYWLIKYNF
ncbi:MAG: hypothetical protein ACI8ZX_001808 [Planctomycetota bacterium]|jgi:hypothetical protein